MRILNSTRDFFKNLGLEDMFYAYHASYQGLTLEFLSSLHEGLKGGRNCMIFRLHNTWFSANLDQIAEIFGLPTSAPTGRKEERTDQPLGEVWRWASGKHLLNYSHLYASEVHHPLLRLFFKFCRECLFACPNSHQIRQVDLYLLAKYLNPNPHCDHYIPGALWKHLFSVSNARGNQPICVGGLITRIAESYGFEYTYTRVPESLFDYDHLYRSRYLLARKDEHGPYKWVVSSRCTFNLSRNAENLPPIFPRPDDPKAFLLEGVSIPEPMHLEDVPSSEAPSTSTHREPPHVEPPLNQPSQGFFPAEPPQWFSDYSGGVMSALGNIQSSINQLQLDNREMRGEISQIHLENREMRSEIAQIRARQDSLWADHMTFQTQAFYPIYDHAFHSGWVRPSAPLPPWYDVPPHFPQYVYGSNEAGVSNEGVQDPGMPAERGGGVYGPQSSGYGGEGTSAGDGGDGSLPRFDGTDFDTLFRAIESDQSPPHP